MKVAVILTGALRTIKKTIVYLKQNLIRDDVDVYACVQNDTSIADDEWNTWFRDELGEHLKTITWFSNERNREWFAHRELLLREMRIDISWKHYLRISGSMIEYFQLQLAYMKMNEYEHLSNMSYEYIVRARTDSVYTKPIDFHWLKWTDEEVGERIKAVTDELVKCDQDPRYMLRYFMSSITSDDAIPNIKNIQAAYYPWKGDNTYFCSSAPITNPSILNTYIKQGRYILTFRKNNLYIVRRELFCMIPSLGTMYGQFKSPYSDAWWFNAEGQFTSACYHSCLTVHDYNTDFEDRSVETVGWKEGDFFDINFNVVNPTMLYCVVRR